MEKSSALQAVVAALGAQAQALGFTDTEWANRASVRKETLSRLRRRRSCDFATLETLAEAVGVRLAVVGQRPPGSDASGHFPSRIGRDYEQRLVDLSVRGELALQHWLQHGPPFFMAGLAVMLASVPGFDRSRLLALAEELHPGVSEPSVFARWLARSPLRASRFMPMLNAARDSRAT